MVLERNLGSWIQGPIPFSTKYSQAARAAGVCKPLPVLAVATPAPRPLQGVPEGHVPVLASGAGHTASFCAGANSPRAWELRVPCLTPSSPITREITGASCHLVSERTYVGISFCCLGGCLCF